MKSKADILATDPMQMRVRAKNDLLEMIGILGLSSDCDVVARTRVSVLSKYL